MPGTSFKNYVVNYDLVVNSTATEGFAQVANLAQRMQKPLKDLAHHFQRMQQSAAALKKGDAFEIKPTIDFTTFDKQAQTLVTRAEKVASQVNAILNGAFTINPAAAKNQGGKGGTKGGTTPSKTETRTLTTNQLKKEAENVKKQLRDIYGPRGVMSEKAKGYRSLVESIQNDAAKLGSLKALRTQLAAVQADIKAAEKNGGKITKTITDGVATGLIKGTKKGGKKLVQQPQVTEAFNSVLQGLTAGKAVQIPVSVVANAKTAESVNTAMAKMRGQIKPIVIPITVATNIDAAKAVRETVQGLQNIITPSSTGTKTVTGGKGGTKGKGTAAPIVKTDEQKALEKELRGLQSEQNKYNFWKEKHDEWQKKIAAINQSNATATPSDAALQKALEKVLYTDKKKKRLTPVSKPKLASLTAAETAELNALTLATDPLIQQKAELENRLAALRKSAGAKALTGKKFEEAKNIKQVLLPQINEQLKAAGEARRTELLNKQAGYARQYETDNAAYQKWLTTGKEQYDKQLDREAKALKNPSIQKKINEAARAFMATPTTKLPVEPKLAEGIRTPEQIEARRAEINQRLAAIGAPVTPTTGKKGTTSGRGTSGASRGLGLSIPITQNLQQLQTLANGKPININTRVISNGQAGFDLNQHIVRLQELALSHPIKLDTRVVATGQAGFDLNMHIQKLQELAMAHPIRLNTAIASNAVGAKGTTPLNTVPLEGMVENVVLAKGVKVTGGPVKVEGLVENVKMGKNGKPIEVKANLVAPSANQLNNLKELSNIWKVLPKTGSRTYTINLKMPGIENIGKLRELASMVGTMPPSQRRFYNNGIGQAGGRSGSSSMYVGRGPNTATRYAGRPRGTMNTFAYQLMGNTSLGARTPVFLDMMKGMGMMSGVGAAMSTLTEAFTNASEYQNTMVTAKSILEANYQGGNFDRDFGNMEKIVRDVARNTKFTAPQAADAARFMAMAGLNIPMINASIRPIADVAVIGDNDLGEVADKITNIQTAFGIKPNKMRALADALTKTFTSSNTDMMMLAESMEYAAPMAHLAGAQVEDALAMVGIMGNAGIQGSMAGTTLRMMYQNVINPNKKQQKMWNELGISLKDAQGNPRQLIDILGDLRKKVRLSNDDKNLDGTWKDEGTPIAEAVSRLFRVTASAGAGTLLENLDKVIALAEANRNADGLSQRISEVKQNDVKGMWAKMTSAFTDAVVTEFESNESPIKGYLESLTKYFNSPDFKDMLHDIFDLVTSMLDTLGKFAKIWKGIYDTCGGLIKYVLMAQFWMTQIGYLFAPLRSVWMTIARGYGAMKGLTMGTAAMGAVGGASAMGGTAAMAGGAAVAAGGVGQRFVNKEILAAQQRMAKFDQASFISRGRFNDVSAAHAANAANLEKQIAKKQMQWYAMSNMTGTERALRANDNRSGRWNLAYTNPQAASELPTRHKMMMAREKEVAALQRQLANSEAGVNQARAQMEADAERSRAAHRGTNMLIAAQRHKTRMPNMAALQRMQRMGKISGWGAKVARDGMLLRSAGSAVASTLGMSGMMGGLATAGKALLSFATGPIGLTALAVGALGFGIYKLIDAKKQEEERIRQLNNSIRDVATNGVNRFNEAFKPVGDTVIEGLKNINVGVATINVEKEEKNNRILSNVEELKPLLDLLNIPMVGNRLKDVEDNSLVGFYRAYIEPMQGLLPNLPKTEGEFLSNHGAALANVIGSYAGNEALKAPEFKEANDKIIELAQQFYNKAITWDEYQEKIKAIAEPFNPQGKPLFTIGDNIQNARRVRNSDLITTTEWWQAQYNALLNNVGATNLDRASAEAAHALSVNNIQQGSQEWWQQISKIVGSKNISWGQGTDGEVNFPFPIKDGRIDLAALSNQLSQHGVDLANPLDQYVSMLSSIYRGLASDQNFKDYIKNITEGQFIAHLLTNDAAITRMKAIDDLEAQRRNAVRDTIDFVPKIDVSTLPGFNKAPDGFYKGDILNSLRNLGIPTDSIFNPSELSSEPFRMVTLPSISQKPYSSVYGDSTKTEIKPIVIKIDKIEANATMKEEIDVNQLADLIKEKSMEAIGDLSTSSRWWG